VPKTDARIEANGALDELNVAIGIVRSMLPDEFSASAVAARDTDEPDDGDEPRGHSLGAQGYESKPSPRGDDRDGRGVD